MFKLIFAFMLITSTAFAADNKLIGTDKDGNEIYLISPPKAVAAGIFVNGIVQYNYRIKTLAHNPISPVAGLEAGRYQVYVDHVDHSVIVDCNGLQRITVVDSRLYNNIGKEIETASPDYRGVVRFRKNTEKIITDYFCR